MSQKGVGGQPRRSARQSGKDRDKADGDAQVGQPVDDLASAEKSTVSVGDSEEEVSLRMEAADVSGGGMGSSQTVCKVAAIIAAFLMRHVYPFTRPPLSLSRDFGVFSLFWGESVWHSYQDPFTNLNSAIASR